MNKTISTHAGDCVLPLQALDRTQVALGGGKGAHLGELSRIDGVRVPAGFCVTTDAFEHVLAHAPGLDALLEALSPLAADDHASIRALSAQARGAIETMVMPAGLADSITATVAHLGAQDAYAIRSSATAEDLPNASFAGLQDSYLNVIGCESILRHISRCWASLFTERAVSYRLRKGFDHRKLRMAVVVQRMVPAHGSGVVFTADPLTGHRGTAMVEACYGLGEALVSGLVNADTWKVRDGRIIHTAIATKTLALRATPAGGAQEHAVPAELRSHPTLTDAQVLELVQLGRRIETHFGSPQDIEWCLADDAFHIVQSRPITTLFPVPLATDGAPHVYVSVGHQQMMTDPLRPLGMSLFRINNPRMHEAGGRLFMDVSPQLASPAGRAWVMEMLGKSDPLIGDAIQTLIDRDFIPLADAPAGKAQPAIPRADVAPIATDPAIVEALIAQMEASIAEAKRAIAGKSGVALFDFITQDTREMHRLAFDPRSYAALMAGIDASWWLNDRLEDWLGEKNVADVLTRSAPGNVTSEMGLALMDVADVIRPHQQVVAFLQQVDGDDFMDALSTIPGGREARDALQGWLDAYGVRGVGEIDITNPRWSERPSLLLPLLLGHVRNFAPGAAKRRFEQGLREAREKEQDLLLRLRLLPDGEARAEETRRMIERLRTFIGYREYPKYAMVARYAVYRKALLGEADRLVDAGVLREREDIFYLTLQELQAIAGAGPVDQGLIGQRKQAFVAARALTPPRVLTSEGECVAGAYRRNDVPDGALAGVAVAAGTVEGRARVILDLESADLAPGDILVTAYTDPSWTPLFVSIAGLVTEVGGLMTHGAVIAREYGLPAVVSVEHATRLIRDGQRIRVHGTEGYVELLS